MREFVIYTGLRIVLFLGAFALTVGIWGLIADPVPLIWALVIALAVSGVASYFLLHGQRDAFARRVDARARKASERFETIRSKED